MSEDGQVNVKETVDSCKDLATAKMILKYSLMTQNRMQESIQNYMKYESLASKVIDEIIILMEYHKRVLSPSKEIDEDLKKLIAYPRIVGQSNLGWYLNASNQDIQGSYEKMMKEAEERMEQHFQEYGQDSTREKHFDWLIGK